MENDHPEIDSIGQNRRAEFLHALLMLLIARGGSLKRGEIKSQFPEQLALNAHELERLPSGEPRWWVHLGYHATILVKAGYIARGRGLWAITSEGREATSRHSPHSLMEQAQERYAQWLDRQPPADVEPDQPAAASASDRAKVWLIGTGKNGGDWPRFVEEQCVEVGFAKDPRGKPFGRLDEMTRDQIRVRMREVTGTPNPFNDILCAWQFSHEMQVGDLVIARQGQRRVLGIGRIEGGYEHRLRNGESFHARNMRWLRTGELRLPQSYRMPTKTLTEATDDPGFLDAVRGVRSVAATRSLEGTGVTAEAMGAFFAGHPYLDGETMDGPGEVQPDAGLSLDEIGEQCFVARTRLEEMVTALTSKLAIVLQGPPGTGKTWLAAQLAHHWAGSTERVRRVQFHPALTYEDFVRGLRPVPGGFEPQNGPLTEIAEVARSRPGENFVLLIDEINRANVAKVLGEALSLIEADKRDARHAVELGLRLDGERRFWLPRNLAVIATMNTADRSIAMVDYALRRRFAFFDLPPAFPEASFREWLLGSRFDGEADDSDLDVAAERAELRRVTDQVVRLMTGLNERIAHERVLGPGFTIGHSFFCTLASSAENPVHWMRRVFRTEIRPLLEEYCAEHPRLKESLLGPLAEIEA